MQVNSAFSQPLLHSAAMARGKPKPKAHPETVSAAPLFAWFAADKRRRRDFVRQAGYSDGRITNWKSRGIPMAELGKVSGRMGLTYEEYLVEAGVPAVSTGPVSPNIEEAHAIRRLRKALPAYRGYVLSLALMESHEKQQLFLDIMREHVPDREVEKAYGAAPHTVRSGVKAR